MRSKVLPITIIFLISSTIVGGVNVKSVVVESSDRGFIEIIMLSYTLDALKI